MNPNELRRQKATALTEARTIRDAAKEASRDLTGDEASKIDGLCDQADGLETKAAAIETAEARNTRLDDGLATLTRTQGRRVPPIDPGTSDIKVPNDAPWLTLPRSGSLSAFKGPGAREHAYKAGRWIQGFLLGYGPAREWCQEHDIGFSAAMGGTSNTSGGVLVPDELSNTIIDLRETFGLARRECRVVPMGSDSQLIARRSGSVTARAIGENTEILDSDAQFNQVELNPRKWGALTRIASELAEDAIIDMADWVAFDMAQAFAEAEDDALFNGDGTSTYHGINGIRTKIIDGNHTQGAVAATSPANTFPEIVSGDLSKLMGEIPVYALGNAKWYASQVGWANVFQRLMAAGGGNTLGDLAGPAQYNYLGFPVEISQKMPAGIATDYNGLAMIVFGDMRKAVTFGNRRGFRMSVLKERYAEFDQIGVIATERFDINVHDLGDNSIAGPIVALIGTT